MNPSSKSPPKAGGNASPDADAPPKDERSEDVTDFSLTREQIERQNDRNTSADDLGRAPKSNKLPGSGIDVAGPGGK